MGAPLLPPMTSQRPYLLRAIYEWIVDNGMTPHVLVDASLPGVRVPAHAVKDGRIVLNIAERAVGHLQMGNETLTFSARFAGVSQSVVVPIYAVLAVYSRETGQGMAMPDEDVPGLDAEASPESVGTQTPELVETGPDALPPDDGPTPPKPPRRGGHLRVVK